MSKACDTSVLDALLNVVKTSTRQTVCSAQPANFAGIAAVALASNTMAGGDYTTANGDVSGRKVTMAAKSAVPITTGGTATHVALDNGSTLIYVTTCTNQALSGGNTVNIPAWKVEVANPS